MFQFSSCYYAVLLILFISIQFILFMFSISYKHSFPGRCNSLQLWFEDHTMTRHGTVGFIYWTHEHALAGVFTALMVRIFGFQSNQLHVLIFMIIIVIVILYFCLWFTFIGLCLVDFNSLFDYELDSRERLTGVGPGLPLEDPKRNRRPLDQNFLILHPS